MANNRRKFLEMMSWGGLAGVVSAVLPIRRLMAQPAAQSEHLDLVVIGTGFGGTMTSLSLAYRMDANAAPLSRPVRILLLERGTWWTTPLETVQDKNVSTRNFLAEHGQPFQEWSSLNDARGMFDLVRRCRRSTRRPQGLYDFLPLGKKHTDWLTRITETTEHDGVSVLTASGVGGGSLVYSNITIRPSEKLFDDPRWPGSWRGAAGQAQRIAYFSRAANSISKGVEAVEVKGAAVNTGLSNIVTRSGRLAASWQIASDPDMPKTDGLRDHVQIRIQDPSRPLTAGERELIDRARVFQTAISQLTPHYGAVDLAINDIAPEPQAADAKPRGKNYCERQGRCNIGCLPGARHTLNKQLMRAVLGNFVPDEFRSGTHMQVGCVIKRINLELRALAEVEMISERDAGGYRIDYLQRKADRPTDGAPTSITTDRVIIATGTIGTSELMLRCQRKAQETHGKEGLGDLSERVGFGFATNGDHIAFLDETKERVSLTRGPVTTSVGQFNVQSERADEFFQIEDQGIPKSLAALVGDGSSIAEALAQGDKRVTELVPLFLKRIGKFFSDETLLGHPSRTDVPSTAFDMSGDRAEMEDELTAKKMCVVAQGKDSANGVFRLDGNDLRVSRTDGKAFHEDVVYERIQNKLDKLAEVLRPAGSNAKFFSPIMKSKPVVLTSHPLGGCIMGETVSEGVVDEWGRVFRKSGGVYKGLYIADGSVIPTALGVNPSLTIAAVSLHTADKVLEEWAHVPASGVSKAVARPCTV